MTVIVASHVGRLGFSNRCVSSVITAPRTGWIIAMTEKQIRDVGYLIRGRNGLALRIIGASLTPIAGADIIECQSVAGSAHKHMGGIPPSRLTGAPENIGREDRPNGSG
jgi:hypothetical protein